MKHLVRLPIVIFIIVLVFTAGCREAEEPPTPPPATNTPIPQPTNTAEPSLIAGTEPLHPRLIGQYPASGEEAPLDGVFELYFDQPMHPDTAVSVLDDSGDAVDGELNWPQPRILHFNPNGSF